MLFTVIHTIVTFTTFTTVIHNIVINSQTGTFCLPVEQAKFKFPFLSKSTAAEIQGSSAQHCNTKRCGSYCSVHAHIGLYRLTPHASCQAKMLLQYKAHQ